MLIHGLPGIYTYTGYMFDYKFYIFPKIVKYLYPVSLAAQMATVYLTLTVTMERYVAVCHPLRARSLCTYGRARAAVICIVIVSILYNLPRLEYFHIYFLFLLYRIEFSRRANSPCVNVITPVVVNIFLWVTLEEIKGSRTSGAFIVNFECNPIQFPFFHFLTINVEKQICFN